jgi:hypothetical protein
MGLIRPMIAAIFTNRSSMFALADDTLHSERSHQSIGDPATANSSRPSCRQDFAHAVGMEELFIEAANRAREFDLTPLRIWIHRRSRERFTMYVLSSQKAQHSHEHTATIWALDDLRL